MTPEQAESRRELVHSIVLTRIGAGLEPDPVSAVRIADEVAAAIGEAPQSQGIPFDAYDQLKQLTESLPVGVGPMVFESLQRSSLRDAHRKACEGYSPEFSKAIREMYAQAKVRKLSAAAEYLKGEFGLV